MTDGMPEVTCEVAWVVDPMVRPVDGWVRIDDVDDGPGLRALSTDRGAKVKVADVEAGTAKATWGDPNLFLLPGGFGPWTISTRRRVRFTADGHLVFTGFIDQMSPTWNAGDVQVDMAAVDLLGLIAEDELPLSALEAQARILGVRGYWPLVDSDGQVATASVGAVDGTYRRPVTDTIEMMPWDDRGCVVMAEPSTEDRVGQSVIIDGVGASPAGAAIAWSWRAIAVDFPTWSVSWRDRSPMHSTSIVPEMTLSFGGTTGATLVLADGTNGDAAVSLDLPITSTATHRMVLSVDPGAGTVDLWVDGRRQAWLSNIVPGIDLEALLAGLTTVHAGINLTGTSSSPLDLAAGIGHVAVWDRPLGEAEVLADAAAAATAWDGDTTSQRLHRILDLLGVDPDDRDVDPGVEVCGPTRLGGNALDYLRRIAATEGGTLFVTADGKVALRPRTPNVPTGSLPVFEGGGDGGTPYRDIAPTWDPYRSINTADVTPEGGLTIRSEAPASVAAVGRLSVAIDTLHRLPGAARVAGDALVFTRSIPRLVIDRLDLTPRRADVPAPHALGLDITDVVRLFARPGTGHVAIEQLSVIERVEQFFDFQAWTWTTSYALIEHTPLLLFAWDTPGQGWDESAWEAP